MEGASRAFAHELNSVRTGRASTALLDRVHVDAYGVPYAAQSAGVDLRARGAPADDSARTIAALFQNIEKAIQESDLGLTPNNDGQIIRIGIPQLSEERRKEFVKLVGKMAEEARVAVRNVRRDVLNEVKRAEKDGEVSKNEVGRMQDDVQKLTDAEIKQIDELLHRKEAEILEV